MTNSHDVPDGYFMRTTQKRAWWSVTIKNKLHHKENVEIQRLPTQRLSSAFKRLNNSFSTKKGAASSSDDPVNMSYYLCQNNTDPLTAATRASLGAGDIHKISKHDRLLAEDQAEAQCCQEEGH